MNTLFIGQHIIELSETDSTNTYAIHLLKEKAVAEGTLIFTQNQKAGRGQMGHTWQAERGKNLTFSLVLSPLFLPIEKQFYISKIASLAVFETLTHFLPASRYDIKIKWPNDLLANQQKICGILIENICREQFLQSAVVGVGINVNQIHFHELPKPTTSLALLAQKEFDVRQVLSVFCKQFEAWYLLLKQNRLEHINRSYTSCLYLLHEMAPYQSKEGVFEAQIQAVEESGQLILRTAQNEIKNFSFKELQFMRSL
ncbi:MAG: biotin--[acetyl-CoA-carboxylase] ligase [Bacteroidetes bacterium]|nr:biotin--[acetyl-CoA-carboxylase] ligase [Bacteroidota bacterium]